MSESVAERIMRMKTAAAAFKDEERTALAALQDVRDRLRNCLEQLVETKFGVKRGSVVVYKGKRFLVVRIHELYLRDVERTSDCQPWLEASLYRKDGTLSPVVSTLYSGWSVEP